MKKCVILLCALTTSLSLNIQAKEHGLSFHGFVAQGLAQAKKSNYINDDGDVSTKLTDVGLNASYVINDRMRVSGQVVYTEGGNRYDSGVRVDYALLDWNLYSTANWQVNTYLGRFKNYHWLYSSTRDVPMTRPSIILPQSIYFDAMRDVSIGGDGINVAIKYHRDSLGEFDFNISSGKSPMSDEQTEIIMGHDSTGDLDHDYDLQASLYWKPSLSDWRFGVALTDAEFGYKKGHEDAFSDGVIDMQRLYANAYYQAENWTFSAEVMQEKMQLDGLLYPSFYNSQTGQGGFVQVEYDVTKDIQLMARYEHFYTNKDDKHGDNLEKSTGGLVPSHFGYQNDGTLGFTYHLSSNTQIQFEHHWIKGTARLTPIVIPNPKANNNEYWQLWAMQLMYWF